jgi:hypothetical protein
LGRYGELKEDGSVQEILGLEHSVAQVFIIVDAEVEGDRTVASPELMHGAATLRQVIADDSPQFAIDLLSVDAFLEQVEPPPSNSILCPLTLAVPATLSFPGQALYQACRDVAALRQQVEQLGFATGTGELWLPIVLTAKGALYAEAIAPSSANPQIGYYQPLHLPDRARQPLYRLGQHLLKFLSAPPAVYLLQFGFQNETVLFDRLLPFPAAPAIASLDVQFPNLFECHWRCLRHQPILDLTITAPPTYQVYKLLSSSVT